MADAKICGLTDARGLDAALAGGARMIGLVFFPKSPRNLALAAAATLADKARGRAEIVAVTVDADDELLGAIADAVKPDWIQAHGSESPIRVGQMKYFAPRVIKVLALARSEDLTHALPYERAADMLMFDAKAPPGADRPGGNALAFDWSILAGRQFARPWLLSGGLNPENVGEAIAASGAAFVDVSSGVESAPGLKDPSRIAAFLAAARA